MAKGNKDTRTRAWTFVLYPDSAPENWREILDGEFLEWVESPIHDKDINADGSPKKPHWHILLLFGGVKSFEQVEEITKKLGAPIPQRVHNSKALVRYMAHLDNPDKAQYNVDEIVGHGGVDIKELLKPNNSERYFYIGEMFRMIRQQGWIYFYQILDYAAENRPDDWFPILVDSSAYVISSYMKSMREEVKDVKYEMENEK